MFRIMRGEYEDVAEVEMNGKPVVFEDKGAAENFVQIYNLDRRQDVAWTEEVEMCWTVATTVAGLTTDELLEEIKRRTTELKVGQLVSIPENEPAYQTAVVNAVGGELGELDVELRFPDGGYAIMSKQYVRHISADFCTGCTTESNLAGDHYPVDCPYRPDRRGTV